jgi:hypothetical protein
MPFARLLITARSAAVNKVTLAIHLQDVSTFLVRHKNANLHCQMLIFLLLTSSTTTKRTSCGQRPMPANSMWSILTMQRYWRLSILLLLVWIHWFAAKLQTRVRCQLRMCQQQGLHERKVQRPLPWLLWPECPVQCLQPYSYVHLHSRICRRSICQLSASSTTTTRYFKHRNN